MINLLFVLEPSNEIRLLLLLVSPSIQWFNGLLWQSLTLSSGLS